MEDSQERFGCPICLTLLDDPVTTACGNNSCMKCIHKNWDKIKFNCPQCRQTFLSRPVLKGKTLRAALMEERKRKNRQNDAAADVCSGGNRKASTFCPVCLASYCDTHLKPHREEPPFKKQNLTQASAGDKLSICGRHDKLLEIYCRTDQQFICLLCLIIEHKGHDTVAVAAEKREIQRQLQWTREIVADRVLNSESEMEKLKKAANSIKDAAWEACDDFERLCMEHIRSVERKCAETTEKVGEAEKTGMDWTDRHLEQLEREVLELKRREHQLQQLTLTEDTIQFNQGFQALDDLPEIPDSHERLDTMTKFVTAQEDKLKNMCDREKNELFNNSEKNLSSLVNYRNRTSDQETEEPQSGGESQHSF